MCRTCVFYEPTNGSPWDRAVFSSVIELRVTQSKGLGFSKSQETNEMNYLSRPLRVWKTEFINIYLDQNLPTQPNDCRFLRKNGQRLFLLSGHLTLSITPDFGKIKNLGQKKSKRWCFVLKKSLYLFYLLFFMTFRLKTDIWRAEMNLDTLTLLCLSLCMQENITHSLDSQRPLVILCY